MVVECGCALDFILSILVPLLLVACQRLQDFLLTNYIICVHVRDAHFFLQFIYLKSKFEFFNI